MNQKQPVAPPHAEISLGDIYYVLFKRKWLILVFALCGFIAAGVVAALQKTTYQSSAQLYINYIAEPVTPEQGKPDAVKVRDADVGTSILASEIQILRSSDSVKDTARFVQPSRILAPYDGGTNEDDAADVILANLVTSPVPASQIINLTFSHRDPTLVQPVLQQIITNYIKEEEEIHYKPGQLDAYLTRKKEIIANRLQQTISDLADFKNAVGVVDLPAAMSQFQAQEGDIVKTMTQTRFALAEAMTLADQLKKNLPATVETNAAAATNSLTPPSAKTIAAYQKLLRQLANLEAKEETLEQHYTSENSLVKTNQDEIEQAENKKEKMEEENPGLLALAPGQSSGPTPAMLAQTAYNNAVARVEQLKSSMNEQLSELQIIQSKGTNLNQLDAKLRELERSRNRDEADLQRIEDSLSLAETHTELGPRISGITVITSPTHPVRDLKKVPKLMAELAAGGVAAGLGLAFLLEMVLDRSFKRPKEVADRLKLRFFLSVPYLNGKTKLQLNEGRGKLKLLPADSGDPQPAPEPKADALAPALNGLVAPWDEKHALRPFHETLRDRLVAYFEELGLTHKPKLVAVTSCDSGAGVSTIASGLASSLSETGEGNVLLVNMNSEEGAAHHFYKGKLALGIDDALQKENRDSAMVQDNLYVVKESGNHDRLPGFLPKRFGHLVSKMKASDYDYIIFDMPPVTQISVTPRLARFMDTVLLVVEAEKTHHDVAQRAAALLGESRANVAVVMNKTRSYVPKRLLQEL
jgi:uncharacterized protein involved in exopolysaccharide biosynthesis/Mrp family chromosome partitioning ATPase